MKTTAEKIAVMQAFERGETIEFRAKGSSNIWSQTTIKVSELNWDWGRCDYRVKQEEKIPDSIDWSHVDTRFNFMARDHGGGTFISTNRPIKSGSLDEWGGYGTISRADGVFISYKRGNLPWDESLIIRPGYKG